MTARRVSAAPPRLAARDVELLVRVGRYRMLTRAQLHASVFANVSATVVRRAIDRLARDGHGFLGTERLNKNGIVVVWLTAKGRDYLVEIGAASATDLFPARGPAAAKDFAHTVALVSAAITVERRQLGFDRILAAWALQRLFEGRLALIPDLLCLRRSSADDPGAALILEVDQGEEAVRVVASKLAATQELLRSYAGSATGILVLTTGERRRASIAQVAADLPGDVPIAIELLDAFTAIADVRSDVQSRERCAGTEVPQPTAEHPERNGAYSEQEIERTNSKLS